MKIQNRCLSAAVLSFCLPSVQADEVTTTQLDAITVTPTRTEQRVEDSLASVTVIDRIEIERRQSQSVQDVLRGVPGLSIINDGGLGKSTSVFMRGTNSDHVLVLIDGVRAGSATLGTTSFQDLPIDQIERIEIVRGPRSSLYGSEAIGGVIQIFTRKGGRGLKPYLSVGAGSHSMYKTTGGVSGGDDKAWYSLNGSRLETRGFNTCDGRLSVENFGGCITNEPDHDGYRNTSGSARAGYRFDNGLEIEGNLLHAEGENEYDRAEGIFPLQEFYPNRSDFVQQMLGGSLKYAPTAFWATSLRAGRTLDESKSFNTATSKDVFNTQRVSTTWQNDFTLAKGHLLTVGLDYYNDQVSGTTNYTVKSRDDKAGFVQYQAAVGAFDAVLAARYDDNEQFGSHPTGNATLGWTFESGVRVFAGWGDAFKAPTFNQLYYQDDFGNHGNPNLLPEESESWEVGVSGRHAGIAWSVNGYHTDVDNLIQWTSDPSGGYSPQNQDKARILGLEAQASTQFMGFDLAANLTLVDPRNLSQGVDHDKALAARPKTLFRFDIDRKFGQVKLGATVNGESRRYEYDYAYDATFTTRTNAYTRPVDGFVTVDLRAVVDVYKGLSLEGRVANLLDAQYRTSRFFYQDDRNFLLTLRYQPEGL